MGVRPNTKAHSDWPRENHNFERWLAVHTRFSMLIGCLGMIISHLIVQTRDKFLSVLYPGATGDVPVLSSTCLQRLSVGGTVRGVIVGDLTRDSGRDGEHHVGSFSNLHLLLVHLCIIVENFPVYGLFFFSLYVFCCSMSKPHGSLHCTVVLWNYKLTFLYIYRKHCKSVFCFITQSSAFHFLSFHSLKRIRCFGRRFEQSVQIPQCELRKYQ